MTDFVDRPVITHAGARRALDGAIAEADSLGTPVVIVITDAAGNTVTMARMDGAPLFSIEVAEKKGWTAAASGARTCDLRDVFNADPTLLHALAPKVDDLMAVGGATPIIVDGATAGAVAVSGATEEQDQQIADAGAQCLA